MSSPLRLAIIGSGNWGSAIARIAGHNVTQYPEQFQQQVKMYVHEEEVQGRKLTEIINQEHENIKYLPGVKLPENVVAVDSAVEAAQGADLLIFVLPHQVSGSEESEPMVEPPLRSLNVRVCPTMPSSLKVYVSNSREKLLLMQEPCR